MKKILSLIIVSMLVISLFVPLFVSKASADSSVYINSADDFMKIKDNLSGSYILNSDITLPDSYVPISDFKGELIGANETKLYSITVNINGGDDTGLFATVSGSAKIKNICLKGSVIGANKTGGFVGSSAKHANAEISNCVNEANVTGADQVGGIAGRIYGGTSFTMIKLTNKGTVTSTSTASKNSRIGGIVGVTGKYINIDLSRNRGDVVASGLGSGGIVGNPYGNVTRCYNTGNVSGGNNVGGIIGLFAQKNTSLTNSFNSGSVTAKTSNSSNYGGAGGLVGSSNYNEITISTSYNIGTVTTNGSSTFAPIISKKNATSSYEISNCYYIEDANAEVATGGTPLNIGAMKKLESFVGFNSEFWEINPQGEYVYPTIVGNLINNGISFASPLSGKVYLEDEIKSIQVVVEGDDPDYVELLIDDKLIAKDYESPFEFSVPKFTEMGYFDVVANAYYDKRVVSIRDIITVTQEYVSSVYDEEFESLASAVSAPWYQHSTKTSTLAAGYYMDLGLVADKDGTSYGASPKIGWEDNADKTFKQIIYGTELSQEYLGGRYILEYDEYVNNDNFDRYFFQVGLNNLTDVKDGMIGWINGSKYEYLYPVCEDTWEHKKLIFDYDNATYTLYRNGSLVFENNALSDTKTAISRIRWAFGTNYVDGSGKTSETANFFSVDNITFIREVLYPYVSDISYNIGSEEKKGKIDIPSDLSKINIYIKGDINENSVPGNVLLYEDNYLIDVEAAYNKEKGTIEITPKRQLLSYKNYRVKLKDDITFGFNEENINEIQLKFNTFVKGYDVLDVGFYINGVKEDDKDNTSLLSGDKIKADVTMVKNNDEEKNYVVILGAYGDNNCLLNFSIVPDTLLYNEYEKTTTTEEITIDENCKEIRVMVWDSLSNKVVIQDQWSM